MKKKLLQIKKILAVVVKYYFAIFGYKILPILKNRFALDPQYRAYRKLLEVPGFLSFPAFKLFSHLEKLGAGKSSTKNADVLEIGVYCGMSLLGLGMLYQNRKITGIDPFFETFTGTSFDAETEFLQHKSKHMSGEARYHTLLQKIKELGMRGRVEVRKETQEEFFTNGSLGVYQLAYVDGEHTHSSIVTFLEKMDSLLVPNGFLVFDDFLSSGFPGISEAVHLHASYKKTLFPICYAFNKGVFVYKPDAGYLDEIAAEVKRFAIENHFPWHQSDHDLSLILHE